MSVMISDVAVAVPSERTKSARIATIVREVALVLVLMFAYKAARTLTKDHIPQAMKNSWKVVDVERALGLYSERTVQRVALHSQTVIEILNRYYVGVHFAMTGLFVLWVIVRHP